MPVAIPKFPGLTIFAHVIIHALTLTTVPCLTTVVLFIVRLMRRALKTRCLSRLWLRKMLGTWGATAIHRVAVPMRTPCRTFMAQVPCPILTRTARALYTRLRS